MGKKVVLNRKKVKTNAVKKPRKTSFFQNIKFKLSLLTLLLLVITILPITSYVSNLNNAEHVASNAEGISGTPSPSVSPSISPSTFPSLTLAPTITPTPTPVNTAIVTTIYKGKPDSQGAQCGPTSLNNYPQSLCTPLLKTGLDSLGYPNRACGSYAAWMETTTGHVMPSYSVLHEAAQWPQNVAKINPSWIVKTPKQGDIAIRPSIGLMPNGQYDLGHAMYVISGNWKNPNNIPGATGDLLVSSYNSDDKGDFAEQVWAPSGTFYGHPFHLIYIRFPLATPTPTTTP